MKSKTVKEAWRYVKGYGKLYQVSNLGNVRSLDRKVKCTSKAKVQYILTFKGRTLKPSKCNGYFRVALCRNNIAKNFTVHRLVARAFKRNPENKPYVNHKNGVKTDNRACNLEWCTAHENNIHALINGLSPKGQEVSGSLLTDRQVLNICELLDRSNLTHTQIAEKYGVSESAIGLIHRGYNWDWLTHRKSIQRPKQEGRNHHQATKVSNCRGEVFDTMKEAAKKYNMSMSHIGCVCKGKRKSSGKYENGEPIKWKYIE